MNYNEILKILPKLSNRDRLKIAQEALRLIQKEENLEKSRYSQIDNKFQFDPEARPIWEIAAEISAKIPDSEWTKVPTDLSKNFDQYQNNTNTEYSE